VTINLPASPSTGYVRLRGISISGQNTGQFGVAISAAQRVYIEDTVIDGFQSGISLVSTAASTLSVSNSTIRNNTVGIFINPASTLTVTAVTAAIFNSRILGSSNYGIYAATSDTAVSNCLIAGNVTGILATSGGTVRISGNTISENNTGISAQTKGTIISYQNNALTGNITANGSPTSTQPLQ
jgi:nitrous oxidase accessory protein NosD